MKQIASLRVLFMFGVCLGLSQAWALTDQDQTLVMETAGYFNEGRLATQAGLPHGVTGPAYQADKESSTQKLVSPTHKEITARPEKSMSFSDGVFKPLAPLVLPMPEDESKRAMTDEWSPDQIRGRYGLKNLLLGLSLPMVTAVGFAKWSWERSEHNVTKPINGLFGFIAGAVIGVFLTVASLVWSVLALLAIPSNGF